MAKTDPKIIDKKLKTALANARKAVGLTQLDVAARLKKPQSFVSKYETGERKLTVGDLVAVCEAIGVKSAKILESVV
jgi:transcriptional regulator with XRE-family HTH domain